MQTIRGVEFEDPAVEKDRIAKVIDAQSPIEEMLVRKTKIPLSAFRVGLGVASVLFFSAAFVFLLLAYYASAPANP